MKLAQLLQNITPDVPEKHRGCYCRYFPVRKGIGIKLYKTPESRDKAIRTQLDFASVGLAPKASRVFTVPEQYRNNVPDDFFYGYVTQSAPYDEDKYNEHGGDEHFEDWGHDGLPPGYKIMDIFYANIGWLRGKPVFIDFSVNSQTKSPNT